VPTSFYDVIVLGDDLAGLIAATLCARRGLRVLVTGGLPAEPEAGVPYAMPRSPHIFVGESSPAVRRVIAELNFIQLVRRKLTLLRPSFQVVLPDARIEVSADADALSRELSRELGEERDAAAALLARGAEISRVLEPVLGQDVTFPPDGFWERREIARSDSRLGSAGDELLAAAGRTRAMLTLPAAFSLPCDPRALTPAAILRAFDLWRRGAARIEGGLDALRTLLLEKLRTQHAGEVRLARATGITTKWSRANGVVLAERGESVGAQHIVAAMPIAELGDIVAGRGDRLPRRVLALSRAIRPTAYRFILNVVLSSAGLPEGISPVTFVVFDPERPLLGDNAFALHIGEPDDARRVIVSLVANVPAPGDGEVLADLLAALVPRLLSRLEELMPFSAEHILATHSPHLPLASGAGGPPPCEPEPLWSSTLPAALAVGGLPYDVGIKAVTPACAQNLPGLGLEGAFAAGWSAARLVSGAAGKKKDYLKDEVLLGT
jgi:hypothetical protein